MANSAGKSAGTEKSTNGAAAGAPQVTWLTRTEAAKRLGVTVRHFLRLRNRLPNGIPGAQFVKGPSGSSEWAFPADAIDAMAESASDAELEDDAPPIDNIEQAQAALMKEVVAASKVVHATAADAIRAAVEAVKGTDHRTSLLLQELERAGKVTAEAQSTALEAVKLVRDLIIDAAKLEAESIKQQADQTIRVERTKVAARGMSLFGPLLKKGFARAMGTPGIAVDAEAETLAAVVADLQQDGKIGELGSVLTDEQRDAMEVLVGAGVGRDKVRAALRKLKESVSPEQAIQIGSILSERQQLAFGSLFEFADADDPKEPKGGAT